MVTKKKRSTPKRSTNREVTYPKPSIKLCGGEKTPITVSMAKKLLGWEPESDKKFNSDFLLKDLDGAKIRCKNNVANRPLYKSNHETLRQEILNGRWNFNGEPIIIGKTGIVLNGQHQLVALILAGQTWERDKESWDHVWKSEPTIEKIIVFGVSENDSVVNTMDTCKSRSLSDVVYRSGYFQSMKTKDRKVISKIMENAVKLLWYRTGEKLLNAFAPMRTHSESLDFIDRHPTLLKCVKHIFEEGESGHIKNCISLGYAAGLMYLMACSDTDPKDYRDTRSEKSLDFTQYDKASDFWVLLAGNSDETAAIRKSISKMQDDEWLTMNNRLSAIVKAWNLFVLGKPIETKSIRIKYTQDENGWKTADELPIIDGIDIGDSSQIDEAHIDVTDPTPEEIEQRKQAELENRKENGKKADRKPTDQPVKSDTKKKTTKRKLQVGSVRWVSSSGKEPWRGKIVELSKKAARLRVLQGFPGSGNTEVADLSDLSVSQPKPA